MKVAIMQPYFLPYIGYWQLIQAVDVFVIYDNIKYTKKGWINRNRFLRNGQDVMFSLPLKNDSDSLFVCERELAANFSPEKLINQLREAYRRAPHFSTTFPLIEEILNCDERNLFDFIYHSILRICDFLEINTSIRKSSSVEINHGLKNEDKVLALCEALGADIYINPIGGLELYSRDIFRARGVEIKFIQAIPFEYPQGNAPFIPWLSILDVLMFNHKDEVFRLLQQVSFK